MEDIKIAKVWVTDTEIRVRTIDGKEASEKVEDYPRLRFATPEQRQNYTLSTDGIHWPELDEDLSFEGFFMKKNDSPLYKLFIRHPELNASAIARRLHMSQSLFAQYVSGTKKPSKERERFIIEEIHKVGKELQGVEMAETTA